ncbi:type II toxin-antitoxin system TacA family antitoxin [Rhizobium sp.]
MASGAAKRDVAVSMRFREQDIDIIDQGAELAGVSRSEFVRQAAVQEAQLAIMDRSVIRLSPEAYEEFIRVLEGPVREMPAKLAERLARPAPWE